MAFGVLFSHQAAEQVQLVRARDRNKDVRVLHARFRQGGDGRAIAQDAHDVVALANMLHTGLIGVHHCHVMAFLTQLACQCRTDLAAAYQNDLHTKILSFLTGGCSALAWGYQILV